MLFDKDLKLLFFFTVVSLYLFSVIFTHPLLNLFINPRLKKMLKLLVACLILHDLMSEFNLLKKNLIQKFLHCALKSVT